MHDGYIRELRNVRYIFYLKRNLISIGTLDFHGFLMNLKNGVTKVMKGAMAMMKGTIKNGLYILDGPTAIGEAIIAVKKGCHVLNYCIKYFGISGTKGWKS